jgi:hypothetical protein
MARGSRAHAPSAEFTRKDKFSLFLINLKDAGYIYHFG